ncbi:MAG: sigma-70 family RNA polymerase sigma factor [Ruminococcaceae bacterium]|nr:sigma-70 family RNA polymerase sigma factor [Oscillospiraceae bacterium]
MSKYESTIDLDRCISKISRRDHTAVEELYREFSGAVYKYALVILRDTGLAEDAMQNTFLRIMASAGTYKLGTNPRAWIFKITRNVCMDIHNSKIPSADDVEPEILSDDHSINDVSEAIAVREAVSRLTDREREVLSLYLFGGLKQTEIAKIMGLSYVRVRSIYECAIKKLRKEFCE